jgi:hypothetical protein
MGSGVTEYRTPGLVERRTELGLAVLEQKPVELLGFTFTISDGLFVPWSPPPPITTNDVEGKDEFSFAFAFDGYPRRAKEREAEPLHLAKAREARYSPQPEGWDRVYMSVTGLRCRSCTRLWEDGEHESWCPA